MDNLEQRIWNDRYETGGHSGAGSYGSQLQKKLELIIQHIPKEEIKTITDVGCGDFNFGKTLLRHYSEAKYLGTDVSDYIVYRNKYYDPQYEFRIWSKYIQKADMILVMDVLFHILEDNDAEEMLQLMQSSHSKYLVLTAYERDEEKDNHVRIRKFDYKRFGEPIYRGVIENEGEMYMYIFKKNEKTT